MPMKTMIKYAKKLGLYVNNSKKMSTFLFLLIIGKTAFSQNSNSFSLNEQLNCFLLIGFSIIFFGFAIYIFRTALNVLHENGRTIQFSFPIFKTMAKNNKMVAFFVALIIILGVIFALK